MAKTKLNGITQGCTRDRKPEVSTEIKRENNLSNTSNSKVEVTHTSTEKEEFTALVDELKSFLECGICTERYLDPQMLPCQHMFCAKCIDSLLVQTKNVCPVCRKRFDPTTQRDCLLMNNLIEFASKHPSLVVATEPTPPVRPHNYVLEDEFPGHGESSYDPSEEYDFSDDESYFDYDEEDISMASYLLHQRIVNYADLMVFLSGNASDEDAPHHTTLTANQPHNRTNHEQRRQQGNNNQHPPTVRPPGHGARPNQPGQNNSQLSFSAATQRRQRHGAILRGINTSGGTAQKIFRRCPEWPNCELGEVCNYTHPWRECRNGALCPYGDTCCFLHGSDFTRLQS